MFVRFIGSFSQVIPPILCLFPLCFEVIFHLLIVIWRTINLKTINLIVTLKLLRCQQRSRQLEGQSKQVCSQESRTILTHLNSISCLLGTCLHYERLYGLVSKRNAIMLKYDRVSLPCEDYFGTFVLANHVTRILDKFPNSTHRANTAIVANTSNYVTCGFTPHCFIVCLLLRFLHRGFIVFFSNIIH